MEKKISLVTAIILIVVISGASFYGGTKFAASKQASPLGVRGANFQGMRNGFTGANGQGRGANGGIVNGEVIKQDSNSITVKLRDGGSKTVYLSDTTTVSKSVDGSKKDVQTGSNVMVIGKASSDGSVIADSVQIRPNLPLDPASSTPKNK
ncbi:hypothetical protein HGA64_02390 [Candidatus Falkowbacteria bacterium]|nr:hypothetical protein [Candidatus Falkowbacteria bacterium]